MGKRRGCIYYAYAGHVKADHYDGDNCDYDDVYAKCSYVYDDGTDDRGDNQHHNTILQRSIIRHGRLNANDDVMND